MKVYEFIVRNFLLIAILLAAILRLWRIETSSSSGDFLNFDGLFLRILGVSAGIIAVWLIYLVIGKLFKSHRLRSIASLLLAVSPWHLQFSRDNWEASIAFTLVLGGTYCFLKGLEKNSKYLAFSIVLFLFSSLMPRMGFGAAIVAAGLILVFWKDFTQISKSRLIASIACLSIIFLLLFQAEKILPLRFYEDKILLKEENLSWQYFLYHSNQLNFLKDILSRWLNYYSARFLFFEGEWQSPPYQYNVSGIGVILLSDLPLLVLGLTVLSRFGWQKNSVFILYLLFTTPLPAVFSQSADSVKSFNMVFPLTTIVALGANYFIERQRRLFVFFTFIYLINYIYFLDQYWVHASTGYFNFLPEQYQNIFLKMSKV